MEQPNISLYLNLFAYIFRPHSCHTEFRLKHGFIGGMLFRYTHLKAEDILRKL